MYNEKIRDGNQEALRFIIKRSGEQVPFDASKIRIAIEKANAEEARVYKRLTKEQIEGIVEAIKQDAYHTDRALSVEEIQDKVLEEIFNYGNKAIYDLYRDYRNKHADRRKMSDIDAKIAAIIDVGRQEDGTIGGRNEEVRQENSNKNPTILSVQRDYMAGEWSRHYVNKYVLTEEMKKAHNEGIIHIHDTDYMANSEHNCDLVNLNDMLQNGTSISGTKIDRPKSFATACTIASQIVAQVASSQYGGQTITLSHLAPFVDVSRQKIRKRLGEELKEAGVRMEDGKFAALVEKELHKEVEAGCQTIQYQCATC